MRRKYILNNYSNHSEKKKPSVHQRAITPRDPNTQINYSNHFQSERPKCIEQIIPAIAIRDPST